MKDILYLVLGFFILFIIYGLRSGLLLKEIKDLLFWDANDVEKGLIMRLFHHNKRKDLSELQGVPPGTFRCDVCKFVLPIICFCGAVADAADKPPKVYVLCGVCAIWLGFGEFRFPQGLCFNFSGEQREKIRALHKELDIAIANKELEETARISGEKFLAGDAEGGLGVVHDYLERTPNLRELSLLRFSLLGEDICDLSGRLTRGEFVAPYEIEKMNKGEEFLSTSTEPAKPPKNIREPRGQDYE